MPLPQSPKIPGRPVPVRVVGHDLAVTPLRQIPGRFEVRQPILDLRNAVINAVVLRPVTAGGKIVLGMGTAITQQEAPACRYAIASLRKTRGIWRLILASCTEIQVDTGRLDKLDLFTKRESGSFAEKIRDPPLAKAPAKLSEELFASRVLLESLAVHAAKKGNVISIGFLPAEALEDLDLRTIQVVRAGIRRIGKVQHRSRKLAVINKRMGCVNVQQSKAVSQVKHPAPTWNIVVQVMRCVPVPGDQWHLMPPQNSHKAKNTPWPSDDIVKPYMTPQRLAKVVRRWIPAFVDKLHTKRDECAAHGWKEATVVHDEAVAFRHTPDALTRRIPIEVEDILSYATKVQRKTLPENMLEDRRHPIIAN